MSPIDERRQDLKLQSYKLNVASDRLSDVLDSLILFSAICYLGVAAGQYVGLIVAFLIGLLVKWCVMTPFRRADEKMQAEISETLDKTIPPTP